MLYKFKSKATSDIIMLEPHGKLILKLIGKDSGVKGIIMPAEMMAAIDALHAAVEREELAIKAAKDAANEADHANEPGKASTHEADSRGTISLKQRVVPFVEMLKRAYSEDKEVVWGV
jgi:cyclopropane-fatty-acyl-phospholipid synthase